MRTQLTQALWSAWYGIGYRAALATQAGPFIKPEKIEELQVESLRAQQFAQFWQAQTDQ